MTQMVCDEIVVQRGFPDEFRPLAADLYDAAFGAKLALAVPDPVARVAILRDGFDPEFSFVARSRGKLMGIAGFKTEAGSLTGGILFSLLKQKVGYWGAIRAVPVLALLQRKQTPSQLLMDGISVAPDMRGKGIGTRLLRSLIAWAKSEGYRSVRLDVIDTNPAARRLYERVGFVPVKTERFAYLEWLLGFGAATQMVYNLSDEA
ncbi:MAG: GNAT family N-acetyltransferase [Caldilineaceae bacterium]|nr:GNAT family N-acetyltransferase [Caldilineaceae bacterium]